MNCHFKDWSSSNEIRAAATCRVDKLPLILSGTEKGSWFFLGKRYKLRYERKKIDEVMCLGPVW